MDASRCVLTHYYNHCSQTTDAPRRDPHPTFRIDGRITMRPSAVLHSFFANGGRVTTLFYVHFSQTMDVSRHVPTGSTFNFSLCTLNFPVVVQLPAGQHIRMKQLHQIG